MMCVRAGASRALGLAAAPYYLPRVISHDSWKPECALEVARHHLMELTRTSSLGVSAKGYILLSVM